MVKFGLLVFYLFRGSVTNLVIWFSIYSVLPIRSNGPALFYGLDFTHLSTVINEGKQQTNIHGHWIGGGFDLGDQLDLHPGEKERSPF